MNTADAYLPYLLKEYKRLESEQQKELEKMPPGRLSVRRTGETINYVQVLTETSGEHLKRIRKGITRNQELVRALARKKYLQDSLKLLEKNIPALEQLVAVHKAPTPTNLINNLPKRYEQLPAAFFLPEIQESEEWAGRNFEQAHINKKAGMRN